MRRGRERGMGGRITLLLFAVLVSAAGQTGVAQCKGGSPCVIGIGTQSYDNRKIFTTAVGCEKSVTVVFSSARNSTKPLAVQLCERTPSGECVQKPSAVLTEFQKKCCQMPPQDRPAQCSADPAAGLPMDVYQCIQLVQHATPWSTSGNATVNATVTFMAPFQSDLRNNGQVEICLVATDNATSAPYCILFQVERCSTCLKAGQSLSVLGKDYGTHWTQLYTSNPQIMGDPDKVEEGQLVRLGMLYTVKATDTLMSIALKFGVSINQMFFWNPHMTPLPATGEVGLQDYALTRDLYAGLDLCILPKTCLASFGPNQPLNFLAESAGPGEGGWWADTPQVEQIDYQFNAPEGGIPQW